MPTIEDMINGLMDKDNQKAYECLKKLEEISAHSAMVYPFFDSFVEMLSSENSYLRTRGLLLIAVNAKWDENNIIDEIIEQYLLCITDEKPITARQCIQTLPAIAKHKPALRKPIKDALNSANLSKYKETMRSLIYKDIQKSLDAIEN